MRDQTVGSALDHVFRFAEEGRRVPVNNQDATEIIIHIQMFYNFQLFSTCVLDSLTTF